MGDKSADVVWVAQTGNKDAIATGFKIGSGAFKSIAQSDFRLDAGLPVSINTGVDDEMNVETRSGAARGLNALYLLWQRKERATVGMAGQSIFKIPAYGTGNNDLL